MELIKFEDTVKVGRTKKKYTISYKCPVCQAVVDGKNIRLEIDKFLINNSLAETARHFREYGIRIDKATYKNHIDKHSGYIKETKNAVLEQAKRASLSKLESLAEDYIDPDEVITEIITLGGQMVRSGEMEVTEKLLLGALKEQGMRKKTGTIRDLMEGLDKNRFQTLVEGEIEDVETPATFVNSTM